MYHLAYFSTASMRFSEEDIDRLLKVSKDNNRKLGITGILLFIEGSFLQVLEGEKENVLDLFQTIRQDDRHYDVIIVFEGEKNKRNFEKWSMGFKGIPLLEYKQQTGFEDISDEDFINNILKKNHPKISSTLKIFYSGGL
jgi:uncharacterized Fe-S cluster-containing MiaB family protein